jgi:hypothetical protein
VTVPVQPMQTGAIANSIDMNTTAVIELDPNPVFAQLAPAAPVKRSTKRPPPKRVAKRPPAQAPASSPFPPPAASSPFPSR